MDVNDMRVVVMLLGLVLFLGIWAWAWSSRRRKAFDEAANLPFLDDETSLGSGSAAPLRKRLQGGDAAASAAHVGDTR